MQATQGLEPGTRVLYRGGSKPHKGIIVQRTAAVADVCELVQLDGEDAPIIVSRFWLTVLLEGDNVPGVSVADLLHMLDQPNIVRYGVTTPDAKGIPVEVSWPDAYGGGETRLVMEATLDRMGGEGSPILRLQVGKNYDK